MAGMPLRKMTVDEYLAQEATASEKHEWVNGEAYAMSGAHPRHNHVALRLGSIVGAQLWPRGCHVAVADQRVQVDPTGAWLYPDLVVACDQPQYAGSRPPSLVNPQLIAEIASASTADGDRGWKWNHYRLLPSLRAYLLVDPMARRVTLYQRRSQDTWQIVDSDGDVTVSIDTLDLVLRLSDVFLGLDGYPEDVASG